MHRLFLALAALVTLAGCARPPAVPVPIPATTPADAARIGESACRALTPVSTATASSPEGANTVWPMAEKPVASAMGRYRSPALGMVAVQSKQTV